MQFISIIWCALVLFAFFVEGGLEIFEIYHIQDPTEPQPVTLTCSAGDWIHIKYIEYQPCRGQYSKCENRNMSGDTLSAACVGRDQCTAKLTVPENAGRVKVYYECIGVNQLSLCDADISGTVFSGPINVLSPDSYSTTGSVGQRCQCNVIGINMTAIIYQLDFRQEGGEFSVIGDGVTVQPPRLNTLFDDVLLRGVKTLTVLYYDGCGAEQYAWIRVEGNGKVTVTCSVELVTLTPTSETTPTSSTPHSPDSATTIGIVCGVILFFIIVISVLVFIMIKYVKRRPTSGTLKKANTSRPPKPVPRQKFSQQSPHNQPRPGNPSPQQAPPGKPPFGSSEYESVCHDYLQLVNTTNAYSQLDFSKEQEYTELDMYETIHEPRQ